MCSKVLLLSTLCLLCSCWGDDSSTRSAQEAVDAPSDDLEGDSSLWRSWKPWNMFRWGHHHSMFNNPLTHSSKFRESDDGGHHIHRDRVDSQRTLTRRESSLIADKPFSEGYDTGRSTARIQSESNTSLPLHPSRPYGSVQRELVTSMFESMLDCIVDSWDVIVPPVKPEDTDNTKTPSEQTFTSKKTKKGAPPPPTGKNSRSKTRTSKLEVLETPVVQNYKLEPPYQTWWSSPDERAIIRFKNGNMYEGSISMKCMHGEGRFQWADGTVYLGQFKDNKMHGKGLIQWKDDTWYEGDVVRNVRHGRGMYVNSRRQAFYTGGWYCGAKHGKGVLHYPCPTYPSLKTNSYDGDWENNIRHGYGSREYSPESGYKGEWNSYVREGKGLMIWPNHDFYRGGWNNGIMSGYGKIIWNAYYNNTMSLPSISTYHGLWHKGERNGYGLLNFGLGLGSHYEGDFKNNKKHGPGKLVTNNGLIMRNKKLLFIDDILGPVTSELDEDDHVEPFQFDICDDTVGLCYHIQQALKNIDKEVEKRTNIINDYFENNKLLSPKVIEPVLKELEARELSYEGFSSELTEFEEISLRKALRNYETDLKNIYYLYSTICNSEEVHFPPIMIRLYLWQFYNDCNMHELGLSLVAIDRLFHACPEWLSSSPHDPFEKIYFWQFLHSLIAVANNLYGKKQIPTVRSDTILSDAFKIFMDKDALPGTGRRKGLLVNGYGSFVPLKGAYELYRILGEPHTVRKFLCATRRPPHYQHLPQPPLVDSPDEATPLGRNVFIYGNEMTFITDELMPPYKEEEQSDELRRALQLFNFGNLSSKSILKIFSQIFPQLYCGEKIMDLNMEITFYEFFEAFVACSQKSIRVKEEEMRWKEKLSGIDFDKIPHAPSPTPAAMSKNLKHV